MEKNEHSLRDLWDSIKYTIKHVLEDLEEKKREGGNLKEYWLKTSQI